MGGFFEFGEVASLLELREFGFEELADFVEFGGADVSDFEEGVLVGGVGEECGFRISDCGLRINFAMPGLIRIPKSEICNG